VGEGGGGYSFVFQNASPFVEDRFCLIKKLCWCFRVWQKGFYYRIPNADLGLAELARANRFHNLIRWSRNSIAEPNPKA